MWLATLLITAVIGYLLIRDKSQVPKTIKGPRNYPLLGTLPDIFATFGSLSYLNRYLVSLYQRYGYTIKVKFLHQERVIICHPDDISAIYKSDGAYPRNVTASFPSISYADHMSGIAHMTLASTEGERWKFLRHELARHIYLPRVASSYLHYINPVTRDLSQLITDTQAKGQLVNLEAIMPFFACEVIGNVMFGKRLNTLTAVDNNNTTSSEAINKAPSAVFAKGVVDFFHQSYCFNFEVPWWRLFMTPKFRRYLDMYQSMRQYVREEVAKVVIEMTAEMTAEMTTNPQNDGSDDSLVAGNSRTGSPMVVSSRGNSPMVNGRDGSPAVYVSSSESLDTVNSRSQTRTAYIKRMLAGSQLSTDELSEGIITLFIGGVDATATALNVLMLYLAENPAVQDKLYEELKTVLAGGDYDEAKSGQLPYLRMVFKELYRIAPPVPGTFRILNQAVTLHSGEVLPVDTNVILCPESIMKDTRYFDKPGEFRPDNWSEAAKEARRELGHDFIDRCINYLPFSFGPRMCIGAGLATVEMYAAICRLIQDFNITLAANQPSYTFISAPFTQASPSPRLVFNPRN